jgi:hypothetical protein
LSPNISACVGYYIYGVWTDLEIMDLVFVDNTKKRLLTWLDAMVGIWQLETPELGQQ